MGATLDAIYRLQNIELQLKHLREQTEAKKRTVRAHRRRVAALDEQIQEKRTQTLQQQIQADRLDLDVKAREADIAKQREMLNRAKTNKEYAAILTQINTSKADNTKLEDRVLNLMTLIDEVKGQVALLQADREREVKRADELDGELAKFEAGISDQIKSLQAQREAASDVIPPQALATFERIAERHEGEAMARVVQPNLKREEFICGGCNMSVTLEQINALQTRDDIQQCNICGRILYIDAPADGPGDAIAEGKLRRFGPPA